MAPAATLAAADWSQSVCCGLHIVHGRHRGPVTAVTGRATAEGASKLTQKTQPVSFPIAREQL